MSVALYIDPVSRDIVIGNEAEFTEDPSPELLLAIGVRLGSLYQDPGQGSTIPSIVSDGVPPVDAKTAIENGAHTALARLEASGLVTVDDVVYSDGELTITTQEMIAPIVIEV